MDLKQPCNDLCGLCVKLFSPGESVGGQGSDALPATSIDYSWIQTLNICVKKNLEVPNSEGHCIPR